MTATDIEIPRTGLIERRFAAPVEVEGRTIVGIVAPYDAPATVSDGGLPYSEVIRPGAFRRALRDPRRTDVLLNYDHRTDIGNVLGKVSGLEDSSEGLRGSFSVTPGPIGDHALELVRSGAVWGFSVAAILHPDGTRIVDGVVERRLFAKLDHVAITTSPAYATAEILAVRSRPPGVDAAEILAKARELRARYDRTPTPRTP